MSSLLNLVVWLIVSGLVIYIVGRLNLGLTVRNFTSAIIAAAVIAVVAWAITWVLGLLGIVIGGGILGIIILLIIAAVVLMISDRFVSGMEVHGFTGAIVAAIAIAVVSGIIGWLLGLLGIVV
jgi:putative membrane protein